MRLWLLLAGLLCACATPEPKLHGEAPFFSSGEWPAEEENECESAHTDICLVPACTETLCGLFPCESLVAGKMVRTRGSLPARPADNPQRNWGSAQRVPLRTEPVLVFHWYRPEELPSQVEARRRLEAWRKRPKERHHIFPQALKQYFASKGINIHDWVLIIDAQEHARLHKDGDGGPWNTEWKAWIARTSGRAKKTQHFDQASLMIQRYNLFGLPVTYWQQFELPLLPPEG